MADKIAFVMDAALTRIQALSPITGHIFDVHPRQLNTGLLEGKPNSESGQHIDSKQKDLSSPSTSENKNISYEPYEYHPLQANEIRLLELIPSEDLYSSKASIISCRLSHYALDNLPPFETLSYCWGTSRSNRTILIDGKRLHIKPNLEAALREFRRPHYLSGDAQGHRTLWIDAICINQEDLEERNHQVSFMCRIYSLSKDLVVWLGEEDETSRIAVDFIHWFSKISKGGLTHAKQSSEWGNRLSSTPLFPIIFQALNQFLDRPWFRRAWVLQEYILGGLDRTVFQCGSSQISGAHMETLCALPHRGKLTRWAHQNNTDYIGGRWQEIFEAKAHHKRTKAQSDAYSILQWLLQARYAEATNPRDKVYAVYGLFEAETWSGYNPRAFVVDYSASVQDVFSNLAKALIASSRRLNVLLACGKRSELVTRSWTPDWTVRSPDLQFIGRYKCEIKALRFHASGDTDAAATFSDDMSTLTVRGIVWDTISAISPPPTDASFKTFCDETWNLIDKNETYKDACTNVFLNQSLGTRNDALFKESLKSQLKEQMNAKAAIRASKREGEKGRPMTASERSQAGKAGLVAFKIAEGMADRRKVWAESERLFVMGRGGVGKDYAGEVRVGDRVCVLMGCPVPVVLREREGEGWFEVVRTVYVEGLMYGEAMGALERGKVEARDFELQ